MSEKSNDPPDVQPESDAGSGEDDVEGHNFEYQRQVARERARADERWVRDEAHRREARGTRKSLRERPGR